MKAFIKRILPSNAVASLKQLKEKLQLQGLLFIGRNRLLAKLGYGLLSSRFSRENYVTAAGIRQHKQLSFDTETRSHARLRRNTHRLEKGLIMQPRRAVFGLNYLPQLVADYQCQIGREGACRQELSWAYSVLTEFFNCADCSNSVIAEAKAVFDEANNIGLVCSNGPYLRQASETNTIQFDELMALARQRRSVRWFQPTPVPRELVEQAVTVASQAPSACNRQPFNVYIIDEPKILARAVTQPMGTVGWADNIPMLAVFVGDFSCFEAARDRHVPYIDSSLAAMNLMLALETLGLSSCPINWPDIEVREKRMAKLLKLRDWQRPIMCMAIGYAQKDGGIAFSQKKLPEQLIRYVD